MFVSFFPHLVAGPIARWNEPGPQISDRLRYRLDGRARDARLVIVFSPLNRKNVGDDQAPGDERIAFARFGTRVAPEGGN
jgi:hypothetical protein